MLVHHLPIVLDPVWDRAAQLPWLLLRLWWVWLVVARIACGWRGAIVLEKNSASCGLQGLQLPLQGSNQKALAAEAAHGINLHRACMRVHVCVCMCVCVCVCVCVKPDHSRKKACKEAKAWLIFRASLMHAPATMLHTPLKHGAVAPIPSHAGLLSLCSLRALPAARATCWRGCADFAPQALCYKHRNHP